MTASITVRKATALPALKRAASAVEGHSSLAILNNLRLISTGDELQITGSDLGTEITATCVATGDCCETTIPARKLLSIVNGLDDDAELTLRVGDDQTSITCGKYRSRLSTLPAADYPVADHHDGITLEIETTSLAALIGGVAHAAATSDVRFYLNGIMLEGSSDGTLTAVATDGHRLAMRSRPLQWVDGQRIIPIAAANTIRSLLRDAETAAVTVGERGLRIHVGATTLTTKLIDGRYPDWLRVVPRDLQLNAAVDRAALLTALARCSILSAEKYKGARLEFDKDELRVSARNPDQEEANETITAKCDEPCGIGFNIQYLTQALNSLTSETALIKYGSANQSIIVLDSGGDQTTALDVVMPMRL